MKGKGKNVGIRNGEGGDIKLKNGRLGKEIKLVATLNTPEKFFRDHILQYLYDQGHPRNDSKNIFV